MEDEVEVPAEAAEVVEETPAEPEVVPEEVPPEEPPPPPPKKKSVQDRIDEITRKMREKEREAEHWREVALAKKEQGEQPAVPEAPQRPRISDFDTTEQYDDAVYEWRRKQENERATAERRKAEETELWKKFNERARKIREEREDFDDVIKEPVFTDAMKIILLHSDNGPELAYFLAAPENRDTAERIMDLPAERQAYEIGKLETNLLLAKRTKKVPSAPPPINPVGMTGGAKEKDPSEMTTEEWMAWDRKREEERLRKRLGG